MTLNKYLEGDLSELTRGMIIAISNLAVMTLITLHGVLQNSNVMQIRQRQNVKLIFLKLVTQIVLDNYIT